MKKPLFKIFCLLLICCLTLGTLPAFCDDDDLEENDNELTDENSEVFEGVEKGNSLPGSIELVTADDTNLIDNFKTQHPRIIVNDFEPIRQKIKDNYMLRQWYEVVKRAADDTLKRDPYPYTVEDKAQHILTLSRNLWHDVYVLAFTYNVERNPVYKERLWEQMKMVAEYPDWAAHSFLGTAETTHAVAIAYDWLYNEWTAEQRKMMSDAMVKNAFETAMVYYHGGTLGGSRFPTMKNNWNAVCNGSLIVGALAIADEEPEFAETILKNAAASLPLGMEEYRTDGAYPEGPTYWTYGTNYLTYLMAALDTALESGRQMPEALRFYEVPGVSQTANYIIHMKAPTGTFNTGDSNVVQNIGGPIMYWHAKKFNQPNYAWAQLLRDRETAPANMIGYERVQSIIWYTTEADNPGEHVPLDKVYKSDDYVNLILLQSAPSQNKDAVYVGMQGGSNTMSHSYLSLGTFILEALGVRWATMRGMGNYEWPSYFGRRDEKGRYQYYTTRAEGQNTLLINPSEKPGQVADAFAPVVRSESADNEAYGILDLTQAYATDVESAVRGVRLFDNRSRVIIQDEVKAKSTIKTGYWFMHTGAQVQISEDGKSVTLFQAGKRLRMNIIEGPENAHFLLMDAKPLPASPQPEVEKISRNYGRKLAIDFSGAKNFKLAVEFIPLYDNQPPPARLTRSPDLKDWRIEDKGVSLGSDMGTAIGMMSGSPYAYFNKAKSLIDLDNKNVAVFEKDGNVMIPVQYLSSNLGAVTYWDEETKSLTVYYRSNTGKFTDGSAAANINGRDYKMGAPATTANGRMFLPLKTIETLFEKKSQVSESGVILLSDETMDLSPEKLTRMFAELEKSLGYSIDVNGKSVEFFNPDVQSCYVFIEREMGFDLSFKTFLKKESVSSIEKKNDRYVVKINGGEKIYNFLPLIDRYSEASRPDGISAINLHARKEDAQTEDVKNTYLDILDLKASRSGTYLPSNLNDSSLETLFTLSGDMWLIADLGQSFNLYAMGIATSQGDKRIYYFDIQASEDGVTWTDVIKGGETSGTTLYPDIVELGGVRARYIKYLGYGNSSNVWTSLSELRFYQSAQQLKEDKLRWPVDFKMVETGGFVAAVGDICSLEIEASLNNGNAKAIPVSVFDVLYLECSDTNVIVLDKENMKFKAVGIGDAVITVSAAKNNLRYKSELKLTVLSS
jgi:hypothetical protein